MSLILFGTLFGNVEHLCTSGGGGGGGGDGSDGVMTIAGLIDDGVDPSTSKS